ncbi:hypothetical protein Ga0123462_1429 [Mariprofundus ferrinatatus]|uniref:SpoIIAA-like n=1 Tax=Mariprofundus ferrinatatus TaxID=1921087 RepID=A0A2K8L5A5_9PROT|nr:hypothetical protein [Mariprofundus ferrinatatus]ATX82292.1 hypothetical protein Ga0123462_1429 [Mariprofundus ferrinatatus]
MPIQNSVDTNERIVYSTCVGKMSKEDFIEYVKEIWSHGDYYGFNELFDVTRGDWSEFNFSYLIEVAKNAAMLRTIDPESKLAWVVLEGKQRELTEFYKSVKLLTQGNRSRSLEAFYSKGDAMRWLRKK